MTVSLQDQSSDDNPTLLDHQVKYSGVNTAEELHHMLI